MRIKRPIALFLFAILFINIPLAVFADDLESPNYKIIDANTNSAGEVTNSQSGDFDLLSSVGDFSGDPRIYSTNYRAGLGAVEIFSANTPKVSCFETDTDGSSSCTTGPAYLNTNGVVTVCGPDGCYDRARFEIDPQNNPDDTLYAIQISTDDFASDLRYIDGVTQRPIDETERTLDEYLTKTDWEDSETNIRGLLSSTEYWIRIVALHGDFTESEPGPSVSATTAGASMNFDLDVADDSGTSAESSPPFAISFTDESLLISNGPATTAQNLIWIDAETNALGGFAILQRGLNGGLFSSSQSYTIASDDADLDGTVEGFGLQDFYTSQQYDTGGGNGSLAAISTITEYNVSANQVGKIDTSYLKVYQTDGPTKEGRMGLKLLARVSGSAPSATDYVEDITVVMVPKY
jgi:hypothetical protein